MEIQEYILLAEEHVNELCKDIPSWKLIILTVVSTVVVFWLKNFLCHDECVLEKGKKTVFYLAKKIPHIRRKIDSEVAKLSNDMVKEMNENVNNSTYIKTLPLSGWNKEKILLETENYCQFGKFKWEEGYASGTVYNGNKVLTDLMSKVYGMAAWANPLHPDVFPGVRKMEAEVVRMCCNLFNGGPNSCGTMTTGGTESIIMACKAYRDYAINVKGIKKPEILIPVTAHAAFDKGAHFLNMKVKHVPVDSETMKVDIKKMRKMITRNTCMLVGSAPQFPQGVIDPIDDISALGLEYDIPVHVDACLGGFLIVFMEAAGYSISDFDFRLKGVTSISADTHKYGYAPKGSSVIMYRDIKWRHHQFFVSPDWPGGIYATATIAGSRPGGIIAACWAALLFHGFNGYVDFTRRIIATAKKIEEGCRNIDGIFVVGKPEFSVVAFGSRRFNIYSLYDLMTKKGWNLNALQFPSCIHIAVTVHHTEEGVAERLLTDIREIANRLLKSPLEDNGKSAALYGMAQSIPDRSLVGELAWQYLDACYITKN